MRKRCENRMFDFFRINKFLRNLSHSISAYLMIRRTIICRSRYHPYSEVSILCWYVVVSPSRSNETTWRTANWDSTSCHSINFATVRSCETPAAQRRDRGVSFSPRVESTLYIRLYPQRSIDPLEALKSARVYLYVRSLHGVREKLLRCSLPPRL